MVLSLSETIAQIRHAASINDQSALKKNIYETCQYSGPKERRNVINSLNRAIVDISIEKNNPGILSAITGISNDTNVELFLPLIQHYIKTQEPSWVRAILKIAQLEGKKSDESHILVILSQMLIETGIEQSNPVLIAKGIETLDLICFRKHRSGLLIEIIPLLIAWAIKNKDVDLLYKINSLILEIGDGSKQSIAYARLADGIAAVAIEKKDMLTFQKSLQIACGIKQKNRRQSCIRSIISSAGKTSWKNSLFDIPSFIYPFRDLSENFVHEIIDAVLWQLLNQEKNREQLTIILRDISGKIPDVTGIIIYNLLKKAQTDGEFYFLSTAIKFQNQGSHQYPLLVREIVKAGISVADRSGNIQALTCIVPVIEKSCNIFESSRIFIQLTSVMVSKDDFFEALKLFSRVGDVAETYPSFDICCVLLFKKSITSDNVSLMHQVLSNKLERKSYFKNISRAVTEICKNFSYQEIIDHIDSINSLILIHPQKNQLLSDSITSLINRGFLDEMEPNILIKLSDSINVQSLREESLSKIVTKIAKIGVREKNRDFLQRSVGLTCLIEEEKTRSATLTSVIDDATVLAVLEGDLDLLRRMRDWSASLLSKESEIYAMSNIVNGMIKYAINRQYPDALEEAYTIARDIHDPSLKKNLIERIFECFVKIGCHIIEENRNSDQPEVIISFFHLFERSLELLYLHWKKEERSLKIAHLIDIVLSANRQKFNLNYYIPLALFALEIEDGYERDAMVSRIVSTLTTGTDDSDSTDPYQVIVHYLEQIDFIQNEPAIIDLVFRSVKQIKDQFTRLSKLSSLAESYLSLNKRERTLEILDIILLSLERVSFIFQRVLLLSDVTHLFSQISQDKAKRSLGMAIQLLTRVEPERESFARKQVVVAIAGLYEIMPEKSLIDEALEIISKISDPVEHIDAMILVYQMARDEPGLRKEIMKSISKSCKTIISPAQQASILLNIAMIINDIDDNFSRSLLKDAEILVGSVKISSIADGIRERIANAYMHAGNKKHENNLVKKAIRIIHKIENEETKNSCLEKMTIGYTHEYEPLYGKIKAIAQKMIDDDNRAGQVVAIENLIRSNPDRLKRVQYFCNISVLFKKRGRIRIASRLLHSAIGEAKIIRPLSLRAYLLCDIAVNLYYAGCEKKAHNIIDDAFDAAIKIRQYHERESVFDNLVFAMKVIHLV